MRVGILVDITKDYRQKLRHAKDLGFDFGQLAVWDMNFYTYENLTSLSRLLKELEFTATDFWCGWSGPVLWNHPDKYASLGLVPKQYRESRLRDLKKGAQFAHALGIKNVITHTGYVPDDPNAEAYHGVVAALKELCSELLERGQSFAFETGEELPYTLGGIIMSIGLPNVGINFDPANFISSGRANPNDAMSYLKSRITGVHAKDAIPASFGEAEGKQVPIGEGQVDFEKLLYQLKESGYQGDIFIEHEMYDRPNRDEDIRRSRICLETLINKVFRTK